MATEEKHLPIRLFQKRDIDTRDTEGGGGPDPSWVLADENLSAHAAQILTQFTQSFSDYLTVDELDFSFPLPVGVKLQEKATAKSHRESIEKVFADENSKITSIGFSPRDELLFALNTREHIKQVGNKFEKPEENKKGISAISKVEKYKPVIEEGIDLKGKLKIKLIPYENMAARKYLQSSFTNFCSQRGVAVKKCNYSISSEIYKISNVTQDSLGEISEFDGVLSIESMPTYEFGPEWIAENKEVDIKLPDQSKEYPKIGVLDSGISKIDHLSPWICGEMSQYTDDVLDKSHGTFVAGVLVYGDVLEDKKLVGCDECKIFDGAVTSDKKLGPIDEDELLDNIREIVSKNKDEVKIWSLSIGSKKEASMQSFSDFGIGLDEIQDTNKILIVKSVGNCQNFEKGRPPSRIAESADSVRSIVVGSIAHFQSQTDISPVNHISPFSRVGPGPQCIIKPELVQYGGNSGLSAEGKRIDSGVLSFSPDGKIICKCGTSFSTPRISALMANLNHNVMGDFNELLIKTLTIHSARYPREVNDTINEKLMRYGFGLPPSIDDILLNSPNEITLILQDDLPKGHFVEILDFPFPNNLVDKNGRYNAEIIVTLINEQLLDGSQGKEYCQSDLEVAFGTYDATSARDISKPIIKNPIGRINSINILREDLYSKRKIQRTGSAFEPILIQNGKYHPVKKFHCDLSGMTEAKKRDYMTAPKYWFLKLSGFYRCKAERISEEAGFDLSQKFCLAITIRDRSRQHDVYTQVAQFLDQRNFVHERIELRPEVRVQH
jgi:hypothetical protein